MFRITEMFHLSESLVALFLAYCFAAAGDLITNWRSDSWISWNQSFVVGLSVATAVLFPLSLLLPAHALLALAILLIAAGGARLYSILKYDLARFRSKARTAIPHTDLVASGIFAVIAVLAIQFIVQNALRADSSDGYQIWSTKAFVLYHRGAMTKDLLIPGEYDRVNAYPFMVSLYEALLSLLRGNFVFDGTKPVFAFFFLSMLISTFYAACGLASRRIALGATALLASVPALSTHTNVEGFADMPQACLVAAVASAFLSKGFSSPPTSFRHPLPWLCIGLTLVKNEGTLLLVILTAVIGLSWIANGWSSFLHNCRAYWRAIAIVMFGFLLRMWMVEWVGGHDVEFASLASAASWTRAYERLQEVLSLCFIKMMDWNQWGLLWPAYLVAIPLILIEGTRRERAGVLATTLALIAYTSLFYFTNWPVSEHISVAYDRLLEQLAPMAVLVLVMAYVRLRSSTLTAPYSGD